jgi:hypothetical protein
MSITTGDDEDEVAQRGNKVIESAQQCVERGQGQGMCHVFLADSDVCQCGKVSLVKERMK